MSEDEEAGEDAASKSGAAWEPIEEPNGTRFGIFDVEGPAPREFAMFNTRKDAEAWLRWRREAGDEDDRLTEYHQVMAVRMFDGRAFFWNSYDPEPAE